MCSMIQSESLLSFFTSLKWKKTNVVPHGTSENEWEDEIVEMPSYICHWFADHVAKWKTSLSQRRKKKFPIRNMSMGTYEVQWRVDGQTVSNGTIKWQCVSDDARKSLWISMVNRQPNSGWYSIYAGEWSACQKRKYRHYASIPMTEKREKCTTSVTLVLASWVDICGIWFRHMSA